VIKIIILCCTDSGNVDATNTIVRVLPSKSMVTADYYSPDWEWFFCNPELKNCWHGRPGIEPTTLDVSSQSGAYDLSATATPLVWLLLFLYFSQPSKRVYFLSKSSSLKIDWLTAYSRLRNIDFTTIPYTFIVSYSHLNYPCLNLGNDIFWHHYFVFLIIKSGFFCSCDLYNLQSWLRSNQRVRWLF